MKIVKSFEDFEYFDSLIEGPNDPSKDMWAWGLGDNGELYFRSTDNEDPSRWYLLRNSRSFAAPFSLRVMKRLVKEFGHLTVFT